MSIHAGERNAIVDVPGIRVGHHQRLDEHWATGVSVVLTPEGATTAVDVRGGGPGTRETDALDPTHLAQQAHAVLLTGGSAYGLSAADGAMLWLSERGYGFRFNDQPSHVVPVVPAAVVFDLPMSDWGNRPDGTFGYAACKDAAEQDTGVKDTGVKNTARRTAQGNVGAGTGAVAGNIKGGIGTASAVLDSGVTVGAMVAVNSSGSVINPATGLPWAIDLEFDGEFGLRAGDPSEIAAAAADRARPGRHGPEKPPLNTTLGVVATDIGMPKSDCKRVAVAAHDGLARAIRPAHAMFDGDTVFAMSTGARGELPSADSPEWAGKLNEVCVAAADVVARAIVHAVLAAERVGEVPAYGDRYPTASS